MKKVKQTGRKKRAAAGPARTDLPPPRVTQALYAPSRFAGEKRIAAVREALAKEFIGGDQLEIRSGAGPLQDGEVVTFHDFSVMGLLPPSLISSWRSWRRSGYTCSICTRMRC